MASQGAGAIGNGWILTPRERLRPAAALRALFACLLVPGAGGCVAGSLATSTGAQPGSTWSTDSRQLAHVGETVKLSFVLKRPLAAESIHALGLADYCEYRIGGERVDADLDADGAFLAEYQLDRVSPGDTVPIVATAWRQVGDRDAMKIGGEWLTNESPNNPPDEPVASSTVRLHIYQAQVEFIIPPIPDGLDVDTARLVLRRRDGRDTVIYSHRPPRRGFSITPDPAGGWTVTYLPYGDELNPTGTTPVELSVFDRAGNRHQFQTEIDTP